METFSRRAALTLLTGAVLAGCDTTHSTSKSDMSPADLDFVTNAFNIIEFDRQECALARTQARSPEVRALAAQFLEQANAFNDRLQPIAVANGIKPPTVLRTDLRVRLARLRLNQGLDFDRSFVEDQIASHQDALNLQEMMMDTPGSNPQIQDLSHKGTAILRTNLATLRELQRKMMPRRS